MRSKEEHEVFVSENELNNIQGAFSFSVVVCGIALRRNGEMFPHKLNPRIQLSFLKKNLILHTRDTIDIANAFFRVPKKVIFDLKLISNQKGKKNS
jgi:hypothetical protein